MKIPGQRMDTLVDNYSTLPIPGAFDAEDSASVPTLSTSSTSSLTSSQYHTPPAARLMSNVGASTSSDGAASQQASHSHTTSRREVIDVDLLDDDELSFSNFSNAATGASSAARSAASSSSHSAASGPLPHVATTSTLGRRRRREPTPPDVICVLDSDEEDEGIIEFGASSTLDDEDEGIAAAIARNRRQRSAASRTSMGMGAGPSRTRHGSFRERLISPPPPRPHQTDIPPLPPLRHLLPRYRNYHGSLPLPSGSSGPSRIPAPPGMSTTGGLIRPNGEPFAFEANLHGRPPPRILGNEIESLTLPLPGSSSSSNGHDRRGVSAAPPPHHTPAMGFGGAFLNNTRGFASGRDRGDGFLTRTRHMANDTITALYHNTLPPSFRFFGLETLFWFGPTEDDEPLLNDGGGSGVGVQMPTGAGWRRKEEEHYQSTYTHPHPPEYGFTFDFAPASPPSPKSKGKAEPEVIVIDDDDDDEVEMVHELARMKGSASEEGDSCGAGPSKPRTVSMGGPPPPSPKLTNALVCALCSDALVLNPSASGDPVEESARRIWGLRCGHLVDGKCVHRLGIPVEIPVVEGENMAGAGVNGKGKGRAKGKGKAKAATVLVGMDHPSAASASAFAIASGSRSSMMSMAPGTPAAVETSPKRAKRRRVKPKVEAEWKWQCPVESCRREHVTVKLGGVWEHGREKGAIQVFV